METQEELLRRYQYLNDNKELILASCIVYDTERNNIRREIKELKTLKRSLGGKDKELKEILDNAISKYKDELHRSCPYLSSKPSEEYINMLEEFILGDMEIEETTLYQYIEAIKADELTLAMYDSMINDLEARRNSNKHLKNVPAFTVWKILSYVRKKYENNFTVLSALDKYYNLDRYTLSGEDFIYGYYIPEGAKRVSYNYPDSTLYASFYGDSVISKYRGNEFEEEDNYHDTLYNLELTEEFYPTKFANALANSSMVINKKEKLKKGEKVRRVTI